MDRSQLVRPRDVTDRKRVCLRATHLAQCLTQPNRLLICWMLIDGGQTAKSLQTTLGIGRSALSNDLQALLEDGVICAHEDGRQLLYRLSDERIGRFVHTLFGFQSGSHMDSENEVDDK